MNYTSKIKVSDDPRGLYRAVMSEKDDLKTDRASVKISLRRSCCFSIKAKDFTSFRAMNNAVMRLITVYTKMRKI